MEFCISVVSPRLFEPVHFHFHFRTAAKTCDRENTKPQFLLHTNINDPVFVDADEDSSTTNNHSLGSTRRNTNAYRRTEARGHPAHLDILWCSTALSTLTRSRFGSAQSHGERSRMARGSTSNKRQPGANQRDTRHDNGLVGPATKRVVKQKSNGRINGQAKSPEGTTSTPPVPGTPPATNGQLRQPILGDSLPDIKMGSDSVRRTSVSGNSDSSASEVYQNPAGQEGYRQIDVTSAKSAPIYHRDPVSFAYTVLKSCPLWDTLAILIVLLQIPPTFLSIIHMIFAFLTFVPPSAVSASGLSFTDVLQGTWESFGTPSFGTIVLIDLIVILVWLFLWSPLQDVALDLAQMVIALTLGGGTSGRETSMRNVLWCLGVIGASHLFSAGKLRSSGFRAFFSSKGLLGPPGGIENALNALPQARTKQGMIGNMIAVHILTQGVVRYIRDWYVRREKRDSLATGGDPEAGKAVPDTSSDSTAATHSSMDTELSATSAGASSSSILKKKKKQSAQVRIRQPLWAALASTKIVMVKEYETSHTAAESAGKDMTDTNSLGNAPFRFEGSRIWITHVGSNEALFSTSYFPGYTSADAPGENDNKPFAVRINGTDLPGTQIDAVRDSGKGSRQEVRWNGAIIGLAPNSKYVCEFVSTTDNQIIFSTSVQTGQNGKSEITGLSPSPQVVGRPDSPVTTYLRGINVGEVDLNAVTQTQKKTTKAQQKALANIRKENDKLSASISNTGKTDEKMRKNIKQLTSHKSQAEQATAAIIAQIEMLDDSEDRDVALFASSRSEHQSEVDKHTALVESVKELETKANEEINVFTKANNLEKEKVDNKKSRLVSLGLKHDRLKDANAKGLDEAQRKEEERRIKREGRENITAWYNRRILEFEAEIEERSVVLQNIANADAQLRQDLYYLQQQNPATSSQNLGVYDGGMNVNANPWNPPAYSMAGHYPAYNMPPSFPTPSHQRTRGRSSSMLSNVSKFTQSSDEGEVPGMDRPRSIWEDAVEDRKSSSGSGSGTGSGSGSIADPKSPTAGKVRASTWR